MFGDYKKRQKYLKLPKCRAALDLGGAASYSETFLRIWNVIWGWNGILPIFLFHLKLHDITSQKTLYLHASCCEYPRSHFIYFVFMDKLYITQTALSSLHIMSSGKNLWHLFSFLRIPGTANDYTIEGSISGILICIITVTTIVY